MTKNDIREKAKSLGLNVIINDTMDMPGTVKVLIPDIRWWMFRKRKAATSFNTLMNDAAPAGVYIWVVRITY